MVKQHTAKEQVTNELAALQQRISELEAAEAEHKRVEEALRESEELSRGLIEAATVGTYIVQDGKFQYINPEYAQISGYTADELLMTYSLDYVHPDDREAVRTKAIEHLKGRDRRSYEFRLVRKDGEIRWILERVASIPYKGQRATIGSFMDISERKRAEEALRYNVERLQRMLGQTVGVLASVVEVRDPTTAGHQRRVAHLASAIASEMGLIADQITGIYMAGLVHDVGAIYTPSDILTKPGRLDDAEFSMVKDQPRVSYDILKMIEFPWPVAEVVLQHRERMDGSGYPAGLSGEDILLEARILGVADVVEAMTSDRPYRPAPGIDVALEEISKNRGILYDPVVVDTCLSLFNEKKFKFE